MKKANVIINEQHSLNKEQVKILEDRYDEYNLVKVPASGWTIDEQKAKYRELADHWTDLVFVSPVPFMLALANGWNAGAWMSPKEMKNIPHVYLLHNDKRDKKELPGGKIIQVVSPTGWQLVDCLAEMM